MRPICLPIDESVQNTKFSGYSAFVAGWGDTEKGGQQSTVLLQLQVPVIDLNMCKKMYQKVRNDTTKNQFSERVLCAGIHKNQGFCQGDSGGPLMLPIRKNRRFPFYQIGIVSYTHGCGEKFVPGVYTSVSFFMDWIKDSIQE